MEHTISDLQAQIDRLSLTLVQWRETQDHLLPLEQRLSQLAERCAELLNHWADTDHRHALAVTEVEARLNDWTAIENRLQRDGAERIRELERTIEHEWKALRDMNEEPARHLREQAAALGETCVAAANLALRGFERSEARFAALESSLQGRLNQLSNDLHTGLAALQRTAALPASGVAPFPLDEVMRIHDDLHEPSGSAPAESRAADPPPPLALPAAPGADARLAENPRSRRISNALLAGGVVVVMLFGLSLQMRLSDATARVVAAERQVGTTAETASREIAAARAQAAEQISAAQDAAAKAQIVSNVLAAPDLLRFNLMGGEASTARGQVMWSRSNGLVLSASGLPAANRGEIYQVWLMSGTGPTSMGLAGPDATGRLTFAAENPLNVPRPVTGVTVTTEPSGGSTSPTGTAVLARAEPPTTSADPH